MTDMKLRVPASSESLVEYGKAWYRDAAERRALDREWYAQRLLKMLWNHAAFGAESGKATNV